MPTVVRGVPARMGTHMGPMGILRNSLDCLGDRGRNATHNQALCSGNLGPPLPPEEMHEFR